MTNSVNTNRGALVALQSLNRTNSDLQTVQKRVTTGYRVNDAVDDGAIFAVAQAVRSDGGALGAVNSQLSVAQGTVTVASTAATKMSDAMAKGREVLVKLANGNLTSDQRAKYNTDFAAIKAEVQNYISNARFNGTNLLTGTQTQISVIANPDGTSYDILSMSLSASIVSAFAAVAGASSASTLLSASFQAAEQKIGDALNSFGANIRRLKAQIQYNSNFQDALTTSLGGMVDADLAKESANLQALQIKQQLGTQTLGIANQAPQIMASLFR